MCTAVVITIFAQDHAIRFYAHRKKTKIVRSRRQLIDQAFQIVIT
jgi:hypothetical protein